MGTRVHKVIGYGLTDVEHDDGDVTDPRINMDRIQSLRHSEDEDGGLTVARFYRWVVCNRFRLALLASHEGRNHESVRDHRMDEGLFLMRYLPRKRLSISERFKELEKHELSFYDAVIHAHEFGCSNVMVFLPFSSVDSWSRHDDIMDWAEESSRHGCESYYHSLDNLCGIYPYTGSMVRVRDPKIEILPVMSDIGAAAIKHKSHEVGVDDHGLPCRMMGGYYNQFVGRWAKDTPPMAKGAFLEHLLQDWRPYLPTELLWLLTYMNDKGCFNDIEEIKRSLRPILYVYWM